MSEYECWIKTNRSPLKPKDSELFLRYFNILPEDNNFYRYFLLILTKNIEVDDIKESIHTLNASIHLLDENGEIIYDENRSELAINTKERILEFLHNFNNVFDSHETIINKFTADSIEELNEKSLKMREIREKQLKSK